MADDIPLRFHPPAAEAGRDTRRDKREADKRAKRLRRQTGQAIGDYDDVQWGGR